MPKVTAELFCSICFNDEETQDWTSLVACGHLFHDACIRRWVTPPPPKPGERKTKKPDFCPLCRIKIIRPLGSKNTSKENSRFRKLVFNSEIRFDLSSSPAKLLSSTLLSEVDNDNHGEGNSKGITRRNMMIVDDSEASENEQAVIRQGDTSIQQRQQQQAGAENEAILTESESDEENARPAQRVDPRRLAGEAREVTSPSRPPNNTRENETLGEARATISAKNTQITELKHRLDKTLEELATTKQTSNNLNQEVQIIETRLREQNIELLNEREQVKKLKEDKKGLSKTLRIEVDRVSNLNSTNRKLLDEITLLKQEHTKLKVRYEELEESFNSTIEDLTTRAKEAEQSRDSLKVHFTRIHDLNKRNEVKLEKKRLRINNLEAELLKYKEADEVRRREKGKGRALDQDDNTFHHHHVGNEGAPRDESFAIPRARARSRQVSNKSVDIDDTSLFLDDDAQHEDFEESLLITQVPESDHEELVDIGNEEDEDAFADLDVILSESKPFNANRSLNKSKQSVLSRDPLKEWTNNEKSGKSTLVQQQHPDRSSSSLTQSNGGKKRSLNLISSSSNASDKWADMAIYGKNRNGKSTTAAAAGEKKKARTIF